MQFMPENLRPIESVIVRLRAAGHNAVDIGKRVGKKPGTVNRIEEMIDHKADLPEQKAKESGTGTPVERVIQKHREAGETYGEIGNRLNMSGDRVRAIESYANLRPDDEAE
jgi:DNA-binding CsgD family transcriptional regulator